MSHPARLVLPIVVLVWLAAGCGERPVQLPDAGEPQPPPPPVPAVTTVSPDPGPFNGAVSVTLSTDVPATIFVTTDGSDPSVDGGGAAWHRGEGTLTLELKETTTLTFFSRTAAGADEALRTAQFIRAGGPKGTISGVVVVDTVAVNRPLALFTDGAPLDLGTVTGPKEVPFLIEGLATGNHRVRAAADLDSDGNFLPVLDLSSPTLNVELNLEDPFKASVEGLRLYLGASAPQLCAIQGTITVPEPEAGETVRVSALAAGSLGGGADPQVLLSQLQNGFLIVVEPGRTTYPYALTDLEPGAYMPVPVLFSTGNGGFGMNLVARPLSQVQCAAGEVSTANFEFGPVDLSGAVTLAPATAPQQSFVYGMVAARSVSFFTGTVQAVLMPSVFAPVPATTTFTGGFAGKALNANASFGLRAFTNVESTNPLLEALQWAVVPIGGATPHATVQTQTADVRQDFTVTLP